MTTAKLTKHEKIIMKTELVLWDYCWLLISWQDLCVLFSKSFISAWNNNVNLQTLTTQTWTSLNGAFLSPYHRMRTGAARPLSSADTAVKLYACTERRTSGSDAREVLTASNLELLGRWIGFCIWCIWIETGCKQPSSEKKNTQEDIFPNVHLQRETKVKYK